MDKLEKILKGEIIPIDRVVVDIDGFAVPSKRAQNEYGIDPDIVFVRDDGWTLGAPKSLEKIAYKMWENEWAYFATKDEKKLRPIQEYL